MSENWKLTKPKRKTRPPKKVKPYLTKRSFANEAHTTLVVDVKREREE